MDAETKHPVLVQFQAGIEFNGIQMGKVGMVVSSVETLCVCETAQPQKRLHAFVQLNSLAHVRTENGAVKQNQCEIGLTHYVLFDLSCDFCHLSIWSGST